jgi:hypothetical protein
MGITDEVVQAQRREPILWHTRLTAPGDPVSARNRPGESPFEAATPQSTREAEESEEETDKAFRAPDSFSVLRAISPSCPAGFFLSLGCFPSQRAGEEDGAIQWHTLYRPHSTQRLSPRGATKDHVGVAPIGSSRQSDLCSGITSFLRVQSVSCLPQSVGHALASPGLRIATVETRCSMLPCRLLFVNWAT